MNDQPSIGHPDPPGGDSHTSAAESTEDLPVRTELERRKLLAEIKNLEVPEWRRPAVVFSGFTTIVAVIAACVQSVDSHREYTLAETKLALVKITEAETRRAVDSKTVELAKKNDDLSKTKSILANRESRLATLEALVDVREREYRFVNSRMESAIALLALAKDQLPQDLQDRIERFEFPRSESVEVCGYEEYSEASKELDHYKILYKTPSDNYFLWTWSSQDSSYGGAIYGEWISDSEATEFMSKHADE